MNVSASPSENDVFSLEKWNSYYSELYLPNTILIAIGLFVGISGNATVIFVYQRGLKNKGQGRFFIPILATVDMASVTASSIYNIVQITRHVTFPGSLICGFFVYIIRVILAYSTMIMTAIAVTRCLKICRTVNYKIRTLHLWIFIASAGLFSLISNIPALFVYGIVEVYKKNVTGYMCKEIDNEAHILDKGNVIFIGLFHGTNILIITVSYVLIAIRIFSTYRRQNTPKMNITGTGEIMQSSPNDKRGPKSLWTYRLTLMFFTIQLCMLMAFIPPFIIITEEMSDRDFWERKRDDLSKNVYLAMRMLYFTNAVVNPFIYGFFDHAFRRKLVDMTCKTD